MDFKRIPYNLSLYKTTLTIWVITCLFSCRSKHDITPHQYMRTLAHAGLRLGVDIEENDNHLLFLEAARWIGTPYKNGGNTQTGIDCSGLSCQIYKNVFHTNLPRQSEKQYRNAQLKPGKRLKQGDLLFFKVSKMRKNKCDHVGIYLKEYKFIHASSSKGVIVSSLTDPYWTNCWISAGSYKK